MAVIPGILQNLLLLSATVALYVFAAVNAAQVPPHLSTASADYTDLHARADNASKVQFGYFVNWGTYQLNFQPADINVSTVTHVLYSFAKLDAGGSIVLSDPDADEKKPFNNDTAANDTLHGLLGELYRLKLDNRHLKVILSVGGDTFSKQWYWDFLPNKTERATFVSSAVQMIKDYGFDGIDIDYEYPNSTAVAENYADLLVETRKGLDDFKTQNGDTTPYLLSVAVSAGSNNYNLLNVKKMDSVLDYWNLMAYDYAGPWSNVTGNQANLFGGNISTDQAIQWYRANGASPNKITLGIPLYARTFNDTDGLDKPFNASGTMSYTYKDLPRPGAAVTEIPLEGYSYSYDPKLRQFNSYDTPAIAQFKAEYVQKNGLAGSMFWDLSTDKKSTDSLVATTAEVYGFDNLDKTENHIHFPDSKWKNVRDNMGKGSAAPSGSSASQMPSSSATSTVSTSACTCASASAGSSIVSTSTSSSSTPPASTSA